MKVKLYLFLPFLILAAFSLKAVAKPTATITSATIAAANINQGSTYNVVYAAKMKVTTDPLTINNIKFTLTGSYDNSDLTNVYIYFNASAPVISGASYLGYAVASYAGPHTYSITISKAMAVNDQGYFIIAASLTNNATDNHTMQVNGATNPVTFGYSVATSVVNNQANKAGAQTIQAADITLTSAIIAASNVNQGTVYQVVYAAKMKVATMPVTVNNIKFTLSGNHDNSDLTNAYIYYNATAPVVSGATYLGYAPATYAAPHTYSVSISKAMTVGDQGYFIIAVSLTNTATDNHTIVINGAINPVHFTFVTDPHVTNNQANKAGPQTIQAADITLTSAGIAAADINQGTLYNVVYAAKMKVATEPVAVSNIKFSLLGNHDNGDLTYVYVYYNPTAPVVSGSTYLGYALANYSAPHNYSIGISKAMAAGDAGYFIIAVSLTNNASDNRTVFMNGATNPVAFDFTTDPHVTNTQANKSNKLTIQAADITLTSASIAAANINQGSSNNVVYAAKMKVVTEPVTVNNIKFTLLGNHDNGDLTYVYVYYNATAPVISGATYLGYALASYSAPHDYSIGISKAMTVGDAGYFIISVNLTNNASDNRTVFMNGATNPVEFGFITDPNVIDNQANKSGKLTIQAADITLTTPNISAGNIKQGSTYNVVYAAKMKVVTEAVTVNNIQFTLSGNHDANDLTYVYLYYNATAPVVSGATYLGYSAATYAAPHDYSIGVSKAMAVNEGGYFIVAVSVNAAATTGKTVKTNGSTDPMQFGFTTNPNVTNNQSNNTGTKTIVHSFAPIAAESNDNIGSGYAVSGLFPNPANSSFNFSLTGKKNEMVKAQLTGRAGNVLIEKCFTANEGMNSYLMETSKIPNGIYYLVVSNSEGVKVARQQVIIQH